MGLMNIGEVIAAIVELLSISNILASQDEEDKHSIALWGMQEKASSVQFNSYKTIDHSRQEIRHQADERPKTSLQRQKYNVVSVDKNCYSCSTSNPIVVSAFKMA